MIPKLCFDIYDSAAILNMQITVQVAFSHCEIQVAAEINKYIEIGDFTNRNFRSTACKTSVR